MKRVTSSFVALAASLLLAASSLTLGCASQTASDPNPAASDGLRDCLAACAADPDIVGESMCGTDGVTYSVCTWHCADVPAGVGVVPGACGADGAAPADGPPKAADGLRICDWTKVDGAWIAIACGASLQTPPREALPTPIRPREDGGDATPAALPAEVDHRVRFGLVKSQGTAPACTAFGTTAALEGAIRSTVGEVTVLSEMHLWSRYAVGSMEQALGAAMSGGTATNDTATAAGLPYDAALALAWTKGDAEPDEDLQSKLDDAARFEVVGVDVLGNGTPGEALVGRIQRAIADGHDVVVALGESDEWRLPDENGIISDHEFGERGAHAVLLVGYKSFEGRPYFLLRNSWGRGWGVNGYAYLSFA